MDKLMLFDWGDTLMVDFDYPGPMAEWPETRVVDGVVEAIEALGDDWKIVLATNAADSKEKDIWQALEKCGLEKYIQKVFCFERVGYRKPSREFFEFILNDMQIPAELSVMIGDLFKADVQGAVDAGLNGIWLNHKRQQPRSGERYATIANFTELKRALEELKLV